MTIGRSLALILATLAMPATAQDGIARVDTPRVAVPFAVGERADYQVKFGPFTVGSSYMEVVKLDTVRDRETWHTIFRVRGGVPGYRVNDLLESWIDTRTFSSLRHTQDVSEGSYSREVTFEIFPETRTYFGPDSQPRPSVEAPLDDGSFLYFIRTIPLEVGKEYPFDRYFRPDRNPVRVKVLRKEVVKVPAGTFNAIVVRPIIKARGVFSENGRAEVWFSDDNMRVMLQLKSHMRIGSLSLYLKAFRPGTRADTSSNPPP